LRIWRPKCVEALFPLLSAMPIMLTYSYPSRHPLSQCYRTFRSRDQPSATTPSVGTTAGRATINTPPESSKDHERE
jgi:hypothetical protein